MRKEKFPKVVVVEKIEIPKIEPVFMEPEPVVPKISEVEVVVLRKYLVKDGKIYRKTRGGWVEFSYEDWKRIAEKKAKKS